MLIKNFTMNVICTITVIFYLWLGVSYWEILLKNTTENPVYSSSNIIVNVAEKFNEIHNYN